jgi:ubiquinone/menaquinone biosynthesis C-methylase UbiE/uncharacterized protein YbaR (Trm112 family)
MPSAELCSLLECPRCRRAPLVAGEATLACSACRSQFPNVGSIPWLFADPALALGEWRNRLTLYLAEFAAAARAADADLTLVTRAATRARLTRLADGYRVQMRLVRELLAPLELAMLPMPHAAPLATATRLPQSQDLHSYYANLHRDWAWGDAENGRSLALVAAAFGERRERLLVLGAGAGRLAYDLHQAGAAALTVALDINPLLLLAAERIVAGGTVELVEFPIAPRAAAEVAVLRSLAAPAPVRAGFELLFADAWNAPFAPRSFDAVLTPWLVDIVDVDFESIAAHVNRLLAPGGRWVSFGSLAFPWRRPALRYSPEEVRLIMGEMGFAAALPIETRLPYMASPASRHSRLEDVLLFVGDKLRRAPHAGVPAGSPPWLGDGSLPIPRSPSLALAADASRIQAMLLALVDGHRSLDELARIVAEQGLLPAAEARSAVSGLLLRLHADSERVGAA